MYTVAHVCTIHNGHAQCTCNQFNRPPWCAVKKWIHYEQFLDEAVEAAAGAGASIILAKTTNFVCSSKFRGPYAQAAADFSSSDNLTKARTLDQCKTALLSDYRCPDGTRGRIKELTPSVAEGYCVNGVFDNSGAAYLNHRLRKHIPAVKIVGRGGVRNSGGGGSGGSSSGGNETIVMVFNDSAVQSCQYTDVEDGRHYHPLNTVRVRMLGNLIIQAQAASVVNL